MKFPDFRRYITLNISAFLAIYFIWFIFFVYGPCTFGECTGVFYTKSRANDIFFIIMFIMPVFWLLFPIEVIIKFLINKFIVKNKKPVFNFPKNKFFLFLNIIYTSFFTIGFLLTLFFLFSDLFIFFNAANSYP